MSSDEQVKSKVADEVELFNATVRSTFREVFKDFLDFSTEEYSHSYITYKFKKPVSLPEFDTLIGNIISELNSLYKTEVWDTNESITGYEVDIVFNKLPNKLRKAGYFIIKILIFKSKLFIWAPSKEILNIFWGQQN